MACGYVSIHAPARGATIWDYSVPGNHCFNPRSRAGSDAHSSINFFTLVLFLSTLPRGERQVNPAGAVDGASFNPRSRAGSDLKKWDKDEA